MALLILFGTPLYLVLQGEMELGMRVASAVVLLALLAVFVYSGRKPIPTVTEIPKVAEEIEEEIATPIIETETVTEQNDESIKRSRGKVAAPAVPAPPMPMPPPGSPMPPPMPMPPTGIPAPAIMEERGNVAKRLVIDRDAQTEMEAEVESFVKERREKRSEIRERIQRRRRMELAERRAAKVRMWTELEDGEDLGKTLSDPDHGLEVINEPENPDESAPLGVSYVRIDGNRILKIRMPLNVPEKGVEEEVTPELPDLPPPGLPSMPPPPGPPGMPPPPGPPSMPPPPPPL
ncbi:MAG: hypothetical protein QF635_00510 [Candidatus Thalassarchaeaceae archaeon]|jgi:hypothetical protein|nr:hypothetical protein [Candidatus Thalassarchaeaceae archaeon]MDP7658545.1 hypothetical protein [Candidatus Thalassarchaeaceae archaeon]